MPIGADVAFAVSIYLPDPPKLFALLDPSNDATNSTDLSTKLLSGKSVSVKLQTGPQSILLQAAFGILQWAQYGESFDFETPKNDTIRQVDPSKNDDDETDQGDELLVDHEDYNPAEDELRQPSPDWTNPETDIELNEMPAPTEFKVQLRPYQRQALWWMTQREAQNQLEGSSRQQLDLLEELVQTSRSQSTISRKTSSSSTAPPIQCECGPVMVDISRIPSPAVVDNGCNPDLTHPLWQRRYLTNFTKTKAISFYVQPIFGAAMASPPPPPKPCRGGILADSMGLGKTVMLLALIQSSLAPNTRMEPNTTTLIVTPLSLLAQWQEEIESKTSLTYLVYYGDKKETENFDSVDVVLTTYGSLQGEWITQSKTAEGHSHRWGIVGHTWKRVILDEAHCIKNTATVASRACCLLAAERRWCVSGTIIQNSLDDVYALLKFLQHEPWCQPSFWKSAISSKLRNTDSAEEKLEAVHRVRRLLAPIMLRRTKESLDKAGNPILTLPPVEMKIVSVEFSPAEQQFYDALHRKSLSLFEGFIKAGTASKSWLAIFSLLHRLRQTCDHVALTVKSHIADDEWASNICQAQQDRQLTVTPNGSGDAIDKKFLDDLLGKFRAMQSRSSNNPKCGIDKSKDVDDAPYASKIAQMLNEAVQNKASMLNDECSVCLDPISIHDSVVTPCFHIFCKDCLIGVLRNQASPGDQTEAVNDSIIRRLPNGPCPVCNVSIDSSRILRLSESDGRIETSYLKSSLMMKAGTTTIKEREDGVARQTLETAVRGSSSSKLTAILDELDRIWQEDPGSKVLIFSQFLGFLDLMEEAFKKNLIPFARLDGKLSLRDRMAVLQEFGSDHGDCHRLSTSGTKPNAGSVLLISMKAGGVGLNLVAARTVFIADPWWNAAVEDQCVDRIHRIGQTAEKVRVRKFYVRNSVEERIVQLQTRKKSVASQVLCDKGQVESDGEDGSRPSLEDFKILFRDDRNL